MGQRYCHIYVRGASDEWNRTVRLAFYERTPGSLGKAALAAVAAALVIAILSFSPTIHGPSGEMISLLLAVPGIAAAWAGFDDDGRPMGGTLAARLAAVSTLLICSLAALANFDVIPNGLLVSRPGSPSVIFLAAVVSAALSVYSWVWRAIVYSRFLGKDVG